MPPRSILSLHRSLKYPNPQQILSSSTLPYLCLFSTSTSSQSGHNRWSKIRHDKGANDAKRGSAFSKLSQEISIASKSTLLSRYTSEFRQSAKLTTYVSSWWDYRKRKFSHGNGSSKKGCEIPLRLFQLNFSKTDS